MLSWWQDGVICSMLLYFMPRCLQCTIGRVAQWIRRPTSNRKIVGSIPIVVIFHNSEQFKWYQGYCDPPPWYRVVDSFGVLLVQWQCSWLPSETRATYLDIARFVYLIFWQCSSRQSNLTISLSQALLVQIPIFYPKSRGGVAQRIRRLTTNQKIVGSNPIVIIF